MHNVGGVRHRHGVGHLYGIAQGVIDLHGPVTEHLLHRAPFHVLHGDEVRAFPLPDVVNVYDAGMIQRRCSFGFLKETTLAVRGNAFRYQELESQKPVQSQIQRFVDGPHPALT